jgi:hypothetical protein
LVHQFFNIFIPVEELTKVIHCRSQSFFKKPLERCNLYGVGLLSKLSWRHSNKGVRQWWPLFERNVMISPLFCKQSPWRPWSWKRIVIRRVSSNQVQTMQRTRAFLMTITSGRTTPRPIVYRRTVSATNKLQENDLLTQHPPEERTPRLTASGRRKSRTNYLSRTISPTNYLSKNDLSDRRPPDKRGVRPFTPRRTICRWLSPFERAGEELSPEKWSLWPTISRWTISLTNCVGSNDLAG